MLRLSRALLRRLFRIGTLFDAVTQATRDAARAWAMSPVWYGVSSFAAREGGGWRLHARRPYRKSEWLSLKVLAARTVFVASLRLRLASSVRIPRRPTEGLLANVLHVLEVLQRVQPGARVHVDWVLSGNERGFRYGNAGDDVWTALFEQVGARLPRTAFAARELLDLAFWGTGKDRLDAKALQRHRRAYYATIGQWLRFSNKQLRERVDDIARQFPEGWLRIGVHRRVANVRVAELQSDGKVPSVLDFISAIQRICDARGRRDYIVFLATDDTDAVTEFRHGFGPRLVVQDAAQRTTPDAAEVHWQQASIDNAVDVLADALLLACCDILLHASSSVSTFASLLNPEMTLVRVAAGDVASSLTG